MYGRIVMSFLSLERVSALDSSALFVKSMLTMQLITKNNDVLTKTEDEQATVFVGIC